MELSKLKLTEANRLHTENFAIHGIKKQYLTTIFSKYSEDASFFVFADNKEITFFTRNLANGNIQIEVTIPARCQRISIVYFQEGQYTLEKEFIITISVKMKMICKKISSLIQRSVIVFGRGMRYLWREHHFIIPFSLWKKYFVRFYTRVKERGEILFNPFIQMDYLKWIQEFEVEEKLQHLEYQPVLSVLVPVYNVDTELLRQCIDSVLEQSYSNFELCLVDDNSTKLNVQVILKEYEQKDTRVKVKFRKENGHISAATNDALSMATGEFICLLDNDDVLAKNALYENVLALNDNKDIDMIYSDEDKLDLKGNRIDPHFKSDFAPDTLLGINYICHFVVLRKSIVEKIGGFTIGLEGVQDHDLLLRFVEQTNKIHHIPKILYHWRMLEGSTSLAIDNKGYAVEKGKTALENALKRRGIEGTVKSVDGNTVYLVEYKYKKEPSVSIIIPMRDYADITKKCIDSIYAKTEYQNFEIIIMDNNSTETSTFKMLDNYTKKYSNFRVIKADMEFNYSRINNLGVQQSDSDIVVLLNNDTEIISKMWLTTLVGYAMQDHIGAVGPKLLYPDNTIQHGGVLLGLGNEVAAHAYIGHPRDDRGMFGRLLIPHNYSAVTAACLAVQRKKYLEVGGLEETLKVAYNDIDFNLKLLSKGYFNLFVPQIELYHYESKSRGLDSSSEKYNQFLKESDYMYKKWKSYIDKDPFYNINFSKMGIYMLEREKQKKV